MDDFNNETTELSEAGTPQGGVISPLLCNIALHGLETELLRNFKRDDGIKIIRYADDLVVMGRKLEDIELAKRIVSEFLKTVNLELSEEKTKIGHTMIPIKKGTKAGLDFLGFHFANRKTSKHRGVKSTKGVKQTFIQVSGPSLESTRNHKEAIRLILRKFKAETLETVISKLATRING